MTLKDSFGLETNFVLCRLNVLLQNNYHFKFKIKLLMSLQPA